MYFRMLFNIDVWMLLLFSFFLSFLDAGAIFVLFCGDVDNDDGFYTVLRG